MVMFFRKALDVFLENVIYFLISYIMKIIKRIIYHSTTFSMFIFLIFKYFDKFNIFYFMKFINFRRYEFK